MPSPDDPQVLAFDVQTGIPFEMTNNTTQAVQYTFDFGEFGLLRFVVPMGGSFRLTPGMRVPLVTMNNVDVEVVDGNNVVAFDDENR